MIVLADKSLRVIDGVRRRLGWIVNDRDCSNRRRPESSATGLLRFTLKVSLPSTKESSLIKTTKLFEVSPAANTSVPSAVM